MATVKRYERVYRLPTGILMDDIICCASASQAVLSIPAGSAFIRFRPLKAERPLAHISWERWASGPTPITTADEGISQKLYVACRVPWISPSRGINESPSHDDSSERRAPNTLI